MAEGVKIGKFMVFTVERLAADPISDTATWESHAFIHFMDQLQEPYLVLRGAQGGDAYEARRSAILLARRKIRRIEKSQERRSSAQALKPDVQLPPQDSSGIADSSYLEGTGLLTAVENSQPVPPDQSILAAGAGSRVVVDAVEMGSRLTVCMLVRDDYREARAYARSFDGDVLGDAWLRVDGTCSVTELGNTALELLRGLLRARRKAD